MKFNEKLQGLRKQKGLSQEKLAEMLGVSRQAISKWEGAQAYPEMEHLILLSDIFGVTLDSFIKEGALKNEADGGGANGDEAQERRARFWDTYGGVYEYKSKRTLWGLPLVHVNIGRGMKRAKGIIAVGNIAQGVIAVGLVALGVISAGAVGVGALFGLGAFAAGLIGVGAVSVGAFAIGALAVGIVALGAVSVGMFSSGALAVASHVAVGDHAYGHIAAGRVAAGVITFVDSSRESGLIHVDPNLVRQAIYDEYPWVWRSIVNLLTAFLAG